MDREYSAEELNHLSKDALIVLFLSMQDQMKQLNMNMEKYWSRLQYPTITGLGVLRKSWK